MSEFTFPFRRMTRALLVPVSATASSFAVPNGFFQQPMYTAFMVVNPNACWVGLRGTSYNADGSAPASATLADADGADWLFNPGHSAVYSTQYPAFMSAIALAMPGYQLPPADGYTPLRVYYGFGA